MGIGIYIDPFSAKALGDRLFEPNTGRYHSTLPGCLAFMKNIFEAQGVRVHTADRIPTQLARILTCTSRSAITQTIST